jgi:hypothetical protein
MPDRSALTQHTLGANGADEAVLLELGHAQCDQVLDFDVYEVLDNLRPEISQVVAETPEPQPLEEGGDIARPGERPRNRRIPARR